MLAAATGKEMIALGMKPLGHVTTAARSRIENDVSSHYDEIAGRYDDVQEPLGDLATRRAMDAWKDVYGDVA
jgi:hypothetical protein